MADSGGNATGIDRPKKDVKKDVKKEINLFNFNVNPCKLQLAPSNQGICDG